MNPPDPRADFDQLEKHLRGLVPSAPSESLTARIFAAFDTPADAAPATVEPVAFPPAPPARLHSWAQPFAAAAAVAVIAGIVALVGLGRSTHQAGSVAADGQPQDLSPSSAAAPVHFVPAHAQNTFLGRDLDGIVYTEDRHPLQAVRYQFTNTYTWENPADGSRVEVQIPIERVRYVPVPTD